MEVLNYESLIFNVTDNKHGMYIALQTQCCWSFNLKLLQPWTIGHVVRGGIPLSLQMYKGKIKYMIEINCFYTQNIYQKIIEFKIKICNQNQNLKSLTFLV